MPSMAPPRAALVLALALLAAARSTMVQALPAECFTVPSNMSSDGTTTVGLRMDGAPTTRLCPGTIHAIQANFSEPRNYVFTTNKGNVTGMIGNCPNRAQSVQPSHQLAIKVKLGCNATGTAHLVLASRPAKAGAKWQSWKAAVPVAPLSACPAAATACAPPGSANSSSPGAINGSAAAPSGNSSGINLAALPLGALFNSLADKAMDKAVEALQLNASAVSGLLSSSDGTVLNSTSLVAVLASASGVPASQLPALNSSTIFSMVKKVLALPLSLPTVDLKVSSTAMMLQALAGAQKLAGNSNSEVASTMVAGMTDFVQNIDGVMAVGSNSFNVLAALLDVVTTVGRMVPADANAIYTLNMLQLVKYCGKLLQAMDTAADVFQKEGVFTALQSALAAP